MGLSQTKLDERLRTAWVEKVKAWLLELGEEAELTKSNTIMFPTLDEEGGDKFVTICISVPKGSREDKEAYDGYGEAEAYKMKLAEQAERKAKAKEEKEKKIAKDKAQREARAKAKAEHEAKKGS